MPVAVVLLQWMGVGGCLWPISSKAIRSLTASCAFKNRLPNSASAADAATPMTLHSEYIAPLRKMGVFALIGFPIK